MCGILGAVNLERPFSDVEKNLLSKNLEKVSYRGPDAAGECLFSSSSIESDKPNIYLGHRRLSIIDLSEDGIQPFTSDEKVFLIFNGEIYNYIELREELKKEGQIFKTETDTEVIVNLYKSGGIEGFRKMNGMWSFILYDQVKQQIILSRDRFSIKPLYIYEEEGLFVFASEIKQILPFVKEVKPNLNVLGNYLMNYLLDYSNQTFFENINKCPPKTNITIDLSLKKKVISQYWDYKQEDYSDRSEQTLIEEFRFLLKDSIKLRLRSDVAIGNSLSGGLDSSSIAVLSKQIGTKDIQNVSVITKNQKHSEEKYVDILQEKAGIKIKKIQNDNTDPWGNIRNIIWQNDEPILSLSTVAHFNMMDFFSKHTKVKVVLSGQGADEILAGHRKYFIYKLAHLYGQNKIVDCAKETAAMLPNFCSKFNYDIAKRYLGEFGQRNSIQKKVITFQFKNFFTNLVSTDFRKTQLNDIDYLSVPALNHYEDRSSMHKSLEIRTPYLDYRLVNFATNLPVDMKINKGWSKYILRKSIIELPSEIAWRKDKKGFNVDEENFFHLMKSSFLKDLFKYSVLEKYGLINAKLFLKEIEKFKNGHKNFWVRDINRIIFAEIWAQLFLNAKLI